MAKNDAAPQHLSAPTRAWFRSVTADYELEPHHLRLLTLACQAWDRGEEARVALAEHGTTYTDRWGAPRTRPEVAVERDCRLAFSRLVRELDLDIAATPEEARPPGLRSNRRL
jgi:phage terminase small subunit